MNKNKLKDFLNIIIIILLGVATVIFAVLYTDTVEIEFITNHIGLIQILISFIISIIVILAIVFSLLKKDFVYKLTLIVLSFMVMALSVLYVLKISGFWDKIDSIEDLRNFVAGYNGFAVPMFIILQFLQVVVLPIPGFITVGAGVALFGPLKGAVYSIIGVTSGSFAGYFIGRVLGYKVASWLVGKESLDKGLQMVKGKDKIILTFMFFFPFFPDDVLCFVAGLSTMQPKFFSIMIILARTSSIFISSYSMNGSIIPYNTWWGILIWAVIFVITVALAIIIYRNGTKIEKYCKKKFSRKKNAKKNGSSR